MGRVNRLLKIHTESYEGAPSATADETEVTTVEQVEAENETNEALNEVDGIVSAKEAVDEIVEQQEANLKEIEGDDSVGSGEAEGEGEEKSEVEASIHIDESTPESTEESAEAIDEQITKETQVMENILGGIGYTASLKKSAMAVAYEDLQIRPVSYGFGYESKVLTPAQKLERRKQLYREHYEGVLATAGKLATSAWEGIKRLVKAIVEYITSWFKTDYKKVGTKLKEKIQSLTKEAGNLKVNDKLKEYNKPTGLGALLCLDNPSDVNQNIGLTLDLARAEIKLFNGDFNKDNHDKHHSVAADIMNKSKELSFTGVNFSKNQDAKIFLIAGSKGITGYDKISSQYAHIDSVDASQSKHLHDGKSALEHASKLIDVFLNHIDSVNAVLKEFKTTSSKQVLSAVDRQMKESKSKNDILAFKGIIIVKLLPGVVFDLAKTSKLIISNVSPEAKESK